MSVVRTRRSYWPSDCSVVFQLGAWFVQVPAPSGGALEGDGVDAGAAGVGRVAGQRDGAADVGCVGRSGDRAGRVGVVDAHGDRRGGERSCRRSSVVTTRRSYWPSVCRVVFQLAAWFVQVPAPIGERWKVDRVRRRSRRRRRSCWSGRSCRGRWRVGRSGDRAGRVGVVDADRDRRRGAELPARSVVRTRRSYWPSACRVVFQLAAWFVQVPAPAGERWKVTVSTPEPPRSAELLASTTVPRISAAAAGFVTEPVGLVLSTRTVIVVEVKELPALSVVTTRRSYWPSACRVVFQLGGLVRPGAGAGGGALEGDGVDAGATGIGGVARQRDRVADVGGVGGSGDRAGRVRCCRRGR